MAAEERICLVDGTNMFFRAFHALPPLTTGRGLPTGAVYGLASMLAKLIRESPKAVIVVVVDAKGKTFRSEIDPAYKANRAPTPPELREQIPWIKRLVPALGLPLVEISGVEADDVIGTLAAQASAAKRDVDIVTSDKDMMQLVGPHVRLVDTMKDQVSGLAEVEKKFGTTPEQVVEVQGLMGDSVDNIPGVRGIGEKTAKRLIQHFGTIDAIFERLEEIESLGLRGAAGIRRKLEEGREDALRSRDLATIRLDVDVEFDADALARQPIDAGVLGPLVEELEFAKLLGDFLGPAESQSGAAETAALETVDAAAILTALGGPDPAAIALAHDAEGVPAGVCLAAAGSVLACPEFPDGLVEALATAPGSAVFVEDWKALLHAAGQATDPPIETGRVEDVGLMSYVLDASRRGHDAVALARDRLGRTIPALRDSDPLERSAAIAGALLELGPLLGGEIESADAHGVYRTMELPLVPVLASMEACGIGIDRAALMAAGEEFQERGEQLKREIHEIAGEEFNIGSTKQLREILFEKLGLPTKGVKKGKTGYSVDADVLAKLAEASPIAQKIIDHRVLAKLNSTYVAGLVELAEGRKPRIHTRFNQTVAATGRLSSSDPNLQNIPIRTEEGRRIRRAFVAGRGQRFVAADYSQIELRVLAHLTGDPVLVRAFREQEDIHRRTAAEVFDVDPVFVSDDMRRQAKVINFGILYGMGPQRLSRELAISRAEAGGIIERYFERYGSVKAFVDRVVSEGRESGYVETMFGRRRPLPDLASKQPGLRQAAERMAWNSPIQGTAADIIKLAMLGVARRLREEGCGARMLLQLHDELFFEVPAGEADALAALVQSEMEGVTELAVPLVAEPKQGRNWAEMS